MSHPGIGEAEVVEHAQGTCVVLAEVGPDAVGPQRL